MRRQDERRGLVIAHAIVGLVTDECCPYCEATPDQRHHPRCPESDGIDVDEIQFCDRCGCSYATACDCDVESEKE